MGLEPTSGTRVPTDESTGAVRWLRLEDSCPDDLANVRDRFPIAWIPLGTIEHHGWHLPVGFDGLKARALCERVATRVPTSLPDHPPNIRQACGHASNGEIQPV